MPIAMPTDLGESYCCALEVVIPKGIAAENNPFITGLAAPIWLPGYPKRGTSLSIAPNFKKIRPPVCSEAEPFSVRLWVLKDKRCSKS